MLTRYLKIPLKTQFWDTDTFTKQKHPASIKLVQLFEAHNDLFDAIRQNLDLLLSSGEGELSFDNTFGLEVWNHNFESKILKHDERKIIENEIINDINKYEPRLKKNSHNVNVHFKDEDKLIEGKKAKIHVMSITIDSVLNEDFKSKENTFSHKLKIPVKVYYKI